MIGPAVKKFSRVSDEGSNCDRPCATHDVADDTMAKRMHRDGRRTTTLKLKYDVIWYHVDGSVLISRSFYGQCLIAADTAREYSRAGELHHPPFSKPL